MFSILITFSVSKVATQEQIPLMSNSISTTQSIQNQSEAPQKDLDKREVKQGRTLILFSFKPQGADASAQFLQTEVSVPK